VSFNEATLTRVLTVTGTSSSSSELSEKSRSSKVGRLHGLEQTTPFGEATGFETACSEIISDGAMDVTRFAPPTSLDDCDKGTATFETPATTDMLLTHVFGKKLSKLLISTTFEMTTGQSAAPYEAGDMGAV